VSLAIAAVTSVSPLRRGWLRVELDGLRLAVPAALVHSLGLTPGAEIDADLLSTAVCEAQAEACGEDAARYMSSRECSSKQLADYLTRRGYCPQVVGRTLAGALERGWVDDSRFARIWVAGHPGKARRALLAGLLARGVSRAAAEEALEAVDDSGLASGLEALVRRRYSGLDPGIATRRAAAFLVRRGFSPALAFRTARAALAKEDDGE
jgi:regulatory protein